MPSPLDDATFSHTLPNVPRRESDASEGGGRRRSSASSGGRFSSLNYQKRQGSGDPAAIARRESYNDQRRESGWLGGLWNNWVRGPNQSVTERRQSESAASTASTASTEGTRTTSVAEQAAATEKGRRGSSSAYWGSGAKHIHGTGAGAAAWRAQYPKSNSGS